MRIFFMKAKVKIVFSYIGVFSNEEEEGYWLGQKWNLL